MRIYVGCSLTKAPEAFKALVSEFKKMLPLDTSCEVLEFIGLTDGTAADVYEHDLGNVASCDGMIAFVQEPSIGLGMELQHAIALGKPLLCLAPADSVITRMVRGAYELGKLSYQEYADAEDALDRAHAFVRGLAA